MRIKNLIAREILDSRGHPTVWAKVTLESGGVGEGAVPSGASTGIHEAHELRDGGSRYGGLGVLRAVKNINREISDALHGLSVQDQTVIDHALKELDGTENKSRLGANAILAVSLACLRAKAVHQKKELFQTIAKDFHFEKIHIPHPLSVVIEGGKHADSNVDFQEFMIVPKGRNITADLEIVTTVYSTLEILLKEKGKNANVGYEGAFGPSLESNREALDLIMEAIRRAELQPGKNIMISLDIAASELYSPENQKYLLRSEEVALNSSQLVSYLEDLANNYPIFSIEDGLAQDDWDGWIELRERIGRQVKLVGDDLFVTNSERIETGIEKGAASAVLIKPNQIGTVTETIEAIKNTQAAGWVPIVSHRSGETNDCFISDLAVGSGCQYIKAGAPARGERVAKYNRLSEISERLG